jgi:hypothetical protein
MANHYRRGELDEAIAVAKLMCERFPDRRTFTQTALAGLYSRAGRTEDALRVASDVQARGVGWWASEVADPDLDAVREDPRFQRIARKFARWEEGACAAARERTPRLLELTPATAATAAVVVLHMYSVTASETAPAWSALPQAGLHVLVAESTLLDGDGRPCWSNTELAARDVRHAVDAARLRAGPGVPVMLAGGSEGAGVAMRLALDATVPDVAAFIAVVGAGSRLEEVEPSLTAAAQRGVRGLFIAGERDELTRQGQERVAAALNARGVLCDLQVVPGMGHGYPDDLGLRISEAMPFFLATKR